MRGSEVSDYMHRRQATTGLLLAHLQANVVSSMKLSLHSTTTLMTTAITKDGYLNSPLAAGTRQMCDSGSKSSHLPCILSNCLALSKLLMSAGRNIRRSHATYILEMLCESAIRIGLGLPEMRLTLGCQNNILGIAFFECMAFAGDRRKALGLRCSSCIGLISLCNGALDVLSFPVSWQYFSAMDEYPCLSAFSETMAE